MKDLKYIIRGFVVGIVCSACMVVGYFIHKDKEEPTEPVVIVDTFEWTNFVYDTVYLTNFDTVKLPVIYTDTDTLYMTDSIMVQVPLSTYIYDTTITDTNCTIDLKAVLSGFSVSLDTLSLHYQITQQKASLPTKKWYDRLGLGVGLGVGLKDGDVFMAPTIGIMYKLR